MRAQPLKPVLLAGLLLLVAGCGMFLGPADRVNRARQALEAGSYAQAVQELKTALESQPDNGAARLLLARASLALGDALSAEKELDHASRAGVVGQETAPLRYQAWLAQGKFQAVLQSAPTDAALPPLQRHLLAARSLMALGRAPEADTPLKAAEDLAPQEAETRQTRAEWYLVSGRLAEAAQALDELMLREPPVPSAVLLRGQLAMGVGDAQAALASYGKLGTAEIARLSVPQQAQLMAGRVEAHLATNDLKSADADLALLQARAGGSFVALFLGARIHMARGNSAAAVESLQRALILDPASVPARLLMGAALNANGLPEQATEILTKLLAEQPQNVQARMLLASLRLKSNDQQAAERLLAEAPPAARTAEGANLDWMSGTLLLQSGKTDAAIGQLEQALQQQSGNAELRMDLARAYLRAGRREDALAVLRPLKPGQGGAARGQLLVLAMTSGRNVEAARQVLRQAVKAGNDDLDLLTSVASYFATTGAATEAADIYSGILAGRPDQADAQLGMAALALQRSDFSAAQALLQKVNEHDARDERAYLGLATLARIKGDLTAEVRWLEAAIQADPAAVEARLRLTESLLDQKDPVRARAVAEQALAVTQARPITLNRIGLTYFRIGQFDEALRRFNESVGLGFDDASVNAATALGALGRLDEARSQLEKAVARRPDWAMPVTMLVGMDANQKQFDRAMARIAVFEKAGGNAAVVNELRGDLLTVSGKGAEALREYQRAADRSPAMGLAIKQFNLRVALRLPIPEQSLTRWLDLHPDDVLPRAVLAQHYDSQGKASLAIRNYEVAIGHLADPLLLNNLAWLYYVTGDVRALDTAQRAYQLRPQLPAIQDTYGWILTEADKVNEGLPILAAAAGAKDQNDPETKYHYAAALDKAGRRVEAKSVLDALLQQYPRFGSRAKAEALLKKVS